MRISDWSSDVCSSDLGRTSDQADPSFPIPLIPFIPAASLERVMQVHRPLRIGAAAATVAGAVVVDLQPRLQRQARLDRKSVVKGKSVSIRVDLGGRRILKKKNT